MGDPTLVFKKSGTVNIQFLEICHFESFLNFVYFIANAHFVQLILIVSQFYELFVLGVKKKVKV